MMKITLFLALFCPKTCTFQIIALPLHHNYKTVHLYLVNKIYIEGCPIVSQKGYLAVPIIWEAISFFLFSCKKWQKKRFFSSKTCTCQIKVVILHRISSTSHPNWTQVSLWHKMEVGRVATPGKRNKGVIKTLLFVFCTCHCANRQPGCHVSGRSGSLVSNCQRGVCCGWDSRSPPQTRHRTFSPI